jgi:hypothetical protein
MTYRFFIAPSSVGMTKMDNPNYNGTVTYKVVARFYAKHCNGASVYTNIDTAQIIYLSNINLNVTKVKR